MVLLATQILLTVASPVPAGPPDVCSTCQAIVQGEEVRASETFHSV